MPKAPTVPSRSRTRGATLGGPASATRKSSTTHRSPRSTIDVPSSSSAITTRLLNRQHDPRPPSDHHIEQCGADAACVAARRVNVSAAFFLSIEFQETGLFAIRVQRAAFGRKSDAAATRISYDQFIEDSRQVGESLVVLTPGWEQRLEVNRQAYAGQVVSSSEFVMKYPLTLSAAEYWTLSSLAMAPRLRRKDRGGHGFARAGRGRVAALRSRDSRACGGGVRPPSSDAYFGYLARPDEAGYQFWLNNYTIPRRLLQAAICAPSSRPSEYRQRSGSNKGKVSMSTVTI